MTDPTMLAKTSVAIVDTPIPRNRTIEAALKISRGILVATSGERYVVDDKHSITGDGLKMFIAIPCVWL